MPRISSLRSRETPSIFVFFVWVVFFGKISSALRLDCCDTGLELDARLLDLGFELEVGRPALLLLVVFFATAGLTADFGAVLMLAGLFGAVFFVDAILIENYST